MRQAQRKMQNVSEYEQERPQVQRKMQNVSEYDEEMQQAHITDQPTAPSERDTEL